MIRQPVVRLLNRQQQRFQCLLVALSARKPEDILPKVNVTVRRKPLGGHDNREFNALYFDNAHDHI